MKKILSIILASVMIVTTFTACGKSTLNSSSSNVSTSVKKESIIYLGFDFGDKAIMDSATFGVNKAAKDFTDKITVQTVDVGTDMSKYVSAIQNAAAKKPDMIIVGTFAFHDAVTQEAPQHPNIKFVIFDDKITDISNVSSLQYEANQSSYLEGMIAAHVSKNGIIGFVGAMDNTPTIWDFLVGYIEGAKAVNPNIKVVTSYVNSFTDSAKAKELTLAQINTNKVDVVFNVGSAAGAGTIEACSDTDTHCIGVDADQAAQYAGKPESKVIISSALKQVGNSLYQVIQSTVNGTYKPGYQLLGITEGDVDAVVDDNTKAVCDSTFLATLSASKQNMSNGTLKVDTAFSMTSAEVAALVKTVQK